MVHIEVSGSGPALVLIHGWALQGAVFAPLVSRLSPHFTLHVVDLPGHGRSRDDATPLQLPDVVEAIASATPPAVWCGWSLGGLFALHAAAVRPQVRGLAMLASSPRFVRATDWPHGMPASAFEQFARDLATDFAGTVDRFLALDLMHAGPTHDALRQPAPGGQQPLVEQLHQGVPHLRVPGEGCRLLETTDLRDLLPGLPVPSLWLAGRRDRLAAPGALQAAAELAPRAQAVTLQHAGHAPFLGQADEVAAHLQRFVAGLP